MCKKWEGVNTNKQMEMIARLTVKGELLMKYEFLPAEGSHLKSPLNHNKTAVTLSGFKLVL